MSDIEYKLFQGKSIERFGSIQQSNYVNKENLSIKQIYQASTNRKQKVGRLF